MSQWPPGHGPVRWLLCWAWGSPRCSASGVSSRVIGTAWTAVKVVLAWCLNASRTRSASGSCSRATSRNSPRCHRGKSCRTERCAQPMRSWRIGASISSRSAAFTAFSMPMGRPIGMAVPGRPRTHAQCRDWRTEGRISSGAGSSPTCPPACGGWGCTSTW